MVSLLLGIIYLSFISLGLPDGLLGTAWPVMSPQFGVPLSYMGIISFTISVGTVISSLLSDRLTRRFGTGRVMAVSVATTALALLGFSRCSSFWMLWLWAVPYGLGGGAVDAALNNFVALNYASRHMSWLHCMWGVGASTGPYIMSFALTRNLGWPAGYRAVFWLQVVLTTVLILSLPLWKGKQTGEEASDRPPMGLRAILRIPGAREILLAFFCFSAVEQTTGLWTCSYLVRYLGVAEETAAGLAGFFFLGITVGRAISGFATYRISDENMIRIGQSLVVLGVGIVLFSGSVTGAMAGILLIGFGSSPIYPCIIHSTPAHFGWENSQALIGVQMASAYAGSCCMPPLFGLAAQHLSLGLFPVFIGLLTAAMIFFSERVNRLTRA